MGASTTAFSGMIRIAVSILPVAIALGCTSEELIRPDQAAMDPGSSLVAFSVNTDTVSKRDAWIRPSRVKIQYGDESISIRIDRRKTGLQLILLEVPALAIMFSEFEVESGTGIFWKRYRTGHSQPMMLTRGEITYVGRIIIEDVKFGEDAGGSRGQPIALKLAFSDAQEDDLLALKQQYEIFRNTIPVQKAVTSWTGQEYLELWPQDSSDDFKGRYLQRALDGTWPDPFRGPVPDDHPH